MASSNPTQIRVRNYATGKEAVISLSSQGTLNVHIEGTLAASINLAGITSGGTMTTNGDMTITGILSVEGAADLQGEVFAGGDMTVSGTLAVEDGAVVDTLSVGGSMVSFGAADSGGAGFMLLRVPNE